MREHNDLLSKARHVGFRTVKSAKNPNSLLLVQGVGATKDNRYDSSLFTPFASLSAANRGYLGRVEIHHFIAIDSFTTVENRYATVAQKLWRAQSNKYCNDQDLLSGSFSAYKAGKEKLRLLHQALADFIVRVGHPEQLALSSVELKAQFLPFFLSGMEPETAAAAVACEVESNSSLALAVHHGIITAEQLVECSGFPREWMEASLLPEDISEQLAAVRKTASFFPRKQA